MIIQAMVICDFLGGNNDEHILVCYIFFYIINLSQQVKKLIYNKTIKTLQLPDEQINL